MKEWDGIERRSEDGTRGVTLESIEEILHRLDGRLEKHLEAHKVEDETFRPYLVELVDILQKSKGAITFLKVLVYVGGILAAFLLWAKDHIKL